MPDETQPPIAPLPKDAKSFGTVPHDSESFRTVPHSSEAFGTLRHVSERKENHTLTVREAARMFEEAGVARTERSIINWCQPNKMGVARLDCYFDPNERRYFVTRESVRMAIEEEKAKATKGGELASGQPLEKEKPVRADAEEPSGFGKAWKDSEDAVELRKENFDLKIANRAKDMFIDQLKQERENIIGQLIQSSHKVGELETRLRIDGPNPAGSKKVDSTAEGASAKEPVSESSAVIEAHTT